MGCCQEGACLVLRMGPEEAPREASHAITVVRLSLNNATTCLCSGSALSIHAPYLEHPRNLLRTELMSFLQRLLACRGGQHILLDAILF